MNLKEVWQEVKYTNSYYKKIMLERIFSGIGVVFFITSLKDFYLVTLIKILVGILIGILFVIRNYNNEQIKEALIREKTKKSILEELQRQKNEEIKLWITGSKDMNELILSIVSLGIIMARLSHFEKLEEKTSVIKAFVKEIENFYEFKEKTKARITEIMKSEPDLFEVTKNLRELEISDYVENKISDFLWQIVLENGYLGIEEEKLLHSWSLYVKTNITK